MSSGGTAWLRLTEAKIDSILRRTFALKVLVRHDDSVPTRVSQPRLPKDGPARTMGRMMWDELFAYCMAKPGAWQDEPWGDGVVTKVGPKIFAFLRASHEVDAPLGVGLKCGATREAADEWLLRYPADAAVMPYIGRSGWNNLRINSEIPDDEIFEAVDASYAMVVSKLPKKDRPVPP